MRGAGNADRPARNSAHPSAPRDVSASSRLPLPRRRACAVRRPRRAQKQRTQKWKTTRHASSLWIAVRAAGSTDVRWNREFCATTRGIHLGEAHVGLIVRGAVASSSIAEASSQFIILTYRQRHLIQRSPTHEHRPGLRARQSNGPRGSPTMNRVPGLSSRLVRPVSFGIRFRLFRSARAFEISVSYPRLNGRFRLYRE